MDAERATVNITPSARILKVLGDIEFEPWQCIAELVDNSFDDFLEQKRAGAQFEDSPRVDIHLPLLGANLLEAEIVIEDNGRGMDFDTLRNAVRAGWSSNDPFTKLGLFGMGFNVATARLGQVTKILTTREGDSEWLGVEIDLDSIGDDFEAPIVREEKNTTADHGTRVVVRRLNPQRGAWLQRNASHLRTTLGAVYSYLLDSEAFQLWVSGVQVSPRRPCVWGEARAVTYGTGQNAEQIPAVIKIDQPLPPMEVCMNCRNWQEPGLGECKECHSADLVARPRRIHGWLGIQRYLHRSEFGIDFLRNGRKILRYDKRLFEWRDPNDPAASADVEYPTELTQGGRVIGEIHLDHVPVNYHKDAFEWNDRSWIWAVNLLRGPGPLLPVKARQHGFPENDSPLGRLHRGYRRHDPGPRCLIPGDGQGPIHEKTREWSERFYAGEPDFQLDDVWWDAVQNHEREKERRANERAGIIFAEPIGAGGGSLRDRLGIGDSADATSTEDEVASPPAPRMETPQERIERYRERGVPVASLTGDFGLVEMNRSVRLRTLDVNGEGLTDDAGNRTPVLLHQERGGEFTAFVDSGHPVFSEFPLDPADFVSWEVAHHLKVRSNHEMPLAEAAALVKMRHLVDYKIDQAVLVGRAQELLRTVREKMAHAIEGNPDRAWQYLNPDERVTIEGTLVSEGAAISLAQARSSGEFVLFAPAMFLPRLVEEWADAFMDGSVFRGPYQEIASPQARRFSVGKVAGYLYDVARLVTAIQPMSKEELVRARYTLQLLDADLVPDGI